MSVSYIECRICGSVTTPGNCDICGCDNRTGNDRFPHFRQLEKCLERIAELEAENKRLREALKK